MTRPQLTPAGLLLIAVALGVLADLLLWDTRWGIGFTLWAMLLAVSLAVLFARFSANAPRGWQGAVLALSFAGIAAAWRDSSVLIVLDVLGVVTCGAVAMMRSREGRLVALRFSDLAKESLAGFIDALIGAPALVAADRSTRRQGAGVSRAAFPVLRGLLLALPLLILFSALFAAADATFEYVLVTVFDIDLAALFRHVFFTGAISWILAGILYGRFLHSHADALRGATSNGPTLGIIEVSLPLGGVALVSAAFVLTQLAYLFGGISYVLGTPEITLADYARRGFFELVTVATLTLPLLLAAEWLLRKESPKARRVFAGIAITQLVLLAVIMASAFHRLFEYQTHFGLTESRFYAAAFLVWVGTVLVVYAATVLRGRRELFVSGALVAGLAVLALVHGLNPDAKIARLNILRFTEGTTLDTGYLGTLSVDAVPVLLESYEKLPEPERSAIRDILIARRNDLQSAGWRSWNLSRSRARGMLEAVERCE